ncbi:MAG: hypothetical protein HGB02_00155 [Chlorobiaceae bacterium]|nr:hypothetical protein [Chlorobiaceae bacterium]
MLSSIPCACGASMATAAQRTGGNPWKPSHAQEFMVIPNPDDEVPGLSAFDYPYELVDEMAGEVGYFSSALWGRLELSKHGWFLLIFYGGGR